MRRRFGSLVAVGFVFIAACGGGDQAPSGQAPPEETTPTLSVTATEYAFQNPATVEAGAVGIDMTNRGEREHVAIVARLRPGVTVEEAKAGLLAPEGEAQGPPPFTFVPGVGALSPGQSGNSTSVLQPGTYIMFCPVPDPDGTPHMAKGMVSSFQATGEAGGALPTAEASVTAQEFAFLNAPQLGAGEHVVSLRNAGKQEHEFVLAELAPGKTVDDIVAFFKQPPGKSGPPPMVLHGGPVMQPGLTATARFTLEAGKQYAFICMVPDFSDDPPTPHVVKGMYTQAFSSA